MTPYYKTISVQLPVRVNRETFAPIISDWVYSDSDWYNHICETDSALYDTCRKELYDTTGERPCVDDVLTEYLLRGGIIKLADCETDDTWLLDLSMLLKGIRLAVPQGLKYDWIVPTADGAAYCIDTAAMDGDDSDCVLQYALFGEIVFG